MAKKAKEIHPFFQQKLQNQLPSSTNASPSLPSPMLKRPSSPSASSSAPPKKKAAPSKAATGSKLKKSKAPEWTKDPSHWDANWSSDRPTGEFGAKSVEKWCILPPYDTTIKDEEWKKYYLERLDKINTSRTKESQAILCDYICFSFKVLRDSAALVSGDIYGSALEEDERQTLARTIRGSLYFLSLGGSDEGDGPGNPRTVSADTRLYSPFGLGTSIDINYEFHLRERTYFTEHFSNLDVTPRTIDLCDPTMPSRCRAGHFKAEGTVQVFKLTHSDKKGVSIKGTTAANISSFEPVLFGTSGWLSPKKMYNLLIHSSTALQYEERNARAVETAGSKFTSYFQDERPSELCSEVGEDTEGIEDEENERDEGWEEEPWDGYGEHRTEEEDKKREDLRDVCVPERMLILAREGWEPATKKKEEEGEKGGEGAVGGKIEE